MTTRPFLSAVEPRCPDYLIELAQKRQTARTAIVRAGAPLPMQAAKAGADKGILEPVFIGEQADIEREAKALDWDISAFEIHPCEGEIAAAAMGAKLASDGSVDVVMKGQLHTDIFMGALVKRDGGIRTGERLVHLFHIADPNTGKAIIISDAAVNISPDQTTRQSAVRMIDKMARATGVTRPKIAFLSATEVENSAMVSSTDAAELAAWARENVPTSDHSGPLALDLIPSPASVETKGLTADPVAGQADGIVVPDIVSGNCLFKALVYVGGGCAGGIVLGGKVPVLLTSRADPPAARLSSICLAAIMS